MTDVVIRSKSNLAMPNGPEEITAAWLGRALGRTRPGIEVRSVRQLTIQHGACTKIRLKIESSDTTLPTKLMVKTGFEPHSPRMRNMYQTEMRAYRDILPSLPANAPRCYYAEGDETGRTMILMEDLDLRGVRFQSLLRPLNFDVACRFLDELAANHARWWGSTELADDGALCWLSRTAADHFDAYTDQLLEPKTFAEYMAAPRGAATPVCLHDGARLRAGLVAMREGYEGQPWTVIHGDTHLGNLFVDPDGRPGFVDWSVRRAPFINEVTYFMVGGLDVPDRRRWEGALLQHYLERLAAHGVNAPSFDTTWLNYRRDIVWGFFIWLLNATAFQSESNNTAPALPHQNGYRTGAVASQ
jgi:hypothetical protein